MNNKSLTVLIVLALSITMHSASNAQIVRKAGGYLFRKAFGETAERTGKSAGRSVVSKSARTAGKSATSTTRRKALTTGLEQTSTKLVKKYGDDAIRAAKKLSPQNARRLQMMSPSIEKSGNGKQLMTLLAKSKNSNQIVEFLYRHRFELAGGVLVAAVIANPDKVLGATSDSVSKVVGTTGREIVTPIAQETVRPLAHWLGFTFFAVLMVVLMGCLANYYFAKLGRRKTNTANTVSDKSKLHRID